MISEARQKAISLAGVREAIERPKVEKWIFDGNGRKASKVVTEDVEPVIESALQTRNHNGGWSQSRNYRRIGSVPLIFIDKWIREHGRECLRDPEFIKRKLNELNKFRTTDGML
jgi:hypothetical protein